MLSPSNMNVSNGNFAFVLKKYIKLFKEMRKKFPIEMSRKLRLPTITMKFLDSMSPKIMKCDAL